MLSILANATWVEDQVISNCSVTCGKGFKIVRQICMSAACGGTVNECNGTLPGQTIDVNQTCEVYVNPESKECYRKKLSRFYHVVFL